MGEAFPDWHVLERMEEMIAFNWKFRVSGTCFREKRSISIIINLHSVGVTSFPRPWKDKGGEHPKKREESMNGIP
jgi:hypothetical protein